MTADYQRGYKKGYDRGQLEAYQEIRRLRDIVALVERRSRLDNVTMYQCIKCNRPRDAKMCVCCDLKKVVEGLDEIGNV